MHFRHRQTDTDIVAWARDVYTSRAKNYDGGLGDISCQTNYAMLLNNTGNLKFLFCRRYQICES